MRKVLVTTIATLATAMLFTMTTSNAATYKFTFQSNDAELTATGEFTVNSANDVTEFPAPSPASPIRRSAGSPPIRPFRARPTALTARSSSTICTPPLASIITGCCSLRREIRAAIGIYGGARPALIRSMNRLAAITTRSI